MSEAADGELRAELEALRGFRNECERQYQERVVEILRIQEQLVEARRTLDETRTSVADVARQIDQWARGSEPLSSVSRALLAKWWFDLNAAVQAIPCLGKNRSKTDVNQNGPAKPAPGNTQRWMKLGECGVDSASLAIHDPVVGLTDNSDVRIPDGQRAGPFGWMGVQFSSGFGDGNYEVWGFIVDYGENGEVDERVAQVVITMIDQVDLDDWRGW